MANPKISIIVALTPSRVIGNSKTSGLLWHLGEDLKRFKTLTMGHSIIMGRKTHESIGRALPGRTNIVVTSKTDYQAEGCVVVHNLQEAIEHAKTLDANEIFIIGGGEIYRQAINLADKLYITLIEKEFNGDVVFPDYSKFNKIIFEQKGESEGLRYKFLELKRS